MTPVFQKSKGKVGDCFKSCVASILDLPHAAVPDWFNDAGLEAGDPIPDACLETMTAWFKKRGLCLWDVPFDAANGEFVMEQVGLHHKGVHYIVSGKSIQGFDHAVVARDGAVVHDPAGPHVGFFGPTSSGYYHISIIGALV